MRVLPFRMVPVLTVISVLSVPLLSLQAARGRTEPSHDLAQSSYAENLSPPQNQQAPAPAGPALQTEPQEDLSRTVVLDPAHGGADFGARGPTGLAESDVVLDFARAARIALEAQRIRVLLTREGNQDPSFDNRSALVNGLHNAIFISLHVSSTGPVGTGRTYYYVFPSDPTQALPSLSSLNPSATAGASASGLLPQMSAAQSVQLQAPSHPALVQWDRAQRSSAEFSRQ